jgi:hypothetical protein
MEKELSSQEFVSFLKNNKAYKEFRKNFYTPSLIKNNPYSVSCRKILIERFSKRKPQSNYDYVLLLLDAFKWEDTKEGWDFWYDMKSRWFEKYCK